MIELHIRIIDDQMAVASHLQTEIHIIKRNCKLFRKASCLQKNFLLHHHTCCSHTAHILQKRGLMEISGTLCRHIHKHVPGNSAHSHHAACMLNGVVRIDQLDANCTCFLTLAHAQHL